MRPISVVGSCDPRDAYLQYALLRFSEPPRTWATWPPNPSPTFFNTVLGEFQLRVDDDGARNALGDRAARGVERMGALGRLALVGGAARQLVPDPDALDDEHLVFDHDVAFSLRTQPALASVDPARFQRASQRAGESTGGGRYHIVECRGMVGMVASQDCCKSGDVSPRGRSILGGHLDG